MEIAAGSNKFEAPLRFLDLSGRGLNHVRVLVIALLEMGVELHKPGRDGKSGDPCAKKKPEDSDF